jgi:hypothetical protein
MMKSFSERGLGPRARLLTATAAAALAALVVAPSAFGASCGYTGATQVFAPWDDPHSYVLAPDGGFEDGASGWSLAGGARVVDGNESHFLRSSADRRSLDLPDGSVATSPPICVALETPFMRSMVRNTGVPDSRLRVEVVYKLLGLVRTTVVTDMRAGDEWVPSRYISPTLGLSTIVGTLIPAAVQVRFRPLDSNGEWQIDDFYVDPHSRR